MTDRATVDDDDDLVDNNVDSSFSAAAASMKQQQHHDTIISNSNINNNNVQTTTVTGNSTDDSNNFNTDEYWKLQIKSVGAQHNDFSINIHPDHAISKLYNEIKVVTGLEVNQQRLIYRGRLITNHDEETDTKLMKDIVGLDDGHTIHLVRKQEQPDSNSTTETTITDDETNSEQQRTSTGSTSASGSSSASLLAALLGMSSTNSEQRRRNNSNASYSHVPHRLQAEDFVRPDPGSMESVRQGLMTLHTLIPNIDNTNNNNESVVSSSYNQRQFYIGQWIDCRDTVNQWLEATVVDILYPNDILTNYDASAENSPTAAAASTSTATSSNSITNQPTSDPAIAVTDLDGRRRLLLEPCEEDESEEQLFGVHYRRRENNHYVQILHIHYNGWPVRWDEWIRSDSERIRPFRVRTRHNTQSQFLSPTVQASMPDPPSTYLTHNDAQDRRALLPELDRVLTSVQTLVHRATEHAQPPTTTSRPNLPWQERNQERSAVLSDRARRARQRELQALAPLLDRLGRMLTDAAPHVAALANDDGENHEESSSSSSADDAREHPNSLGGLLSLLSRDRRRNGLSVSSNVPVAGDAISASVASSTTGGGNTNVEEDEETTVYDEQPILLDPDHTDFATGFVNTTRGEVRNGPRSRNSDELSSLLGAYLAAASLGNMASGTTNNNGEGGNNNDATEGLGRLLRTNANGGIDIHIHAVVTAPGMDGGIGLATLGNNNNNNTTAATLPVATPVANTTTATSSSGLTGLFERSPRRNRRSFASRQSNNNNNNEEELGIFAELYSENPDPVDHNRNNIIDESSENSNNSSSHEPSNSDNGSTSLEVSRHRRSGNHNRPPLNQNGRAPSSRRSGGGGGGVLGRFFRRNSDNNNNNNSNHS